MPKNQKMSAYRWGVIIFLFLLLLLMTEVTVSNVNAPGWMILIFGILQASLIIWEYMHVSRLFKRSERTEEETKDKSPS